MAMMWNKTMKWLGLGPDDEYDDYEPGYDDAPEPAPAARSRIPAAGPGGPGGPGGAYQPSQPPEESSAIGSVRPIRAERIEPTNVPAGPGGVSGLRPRPQVVRPIPAAASAKPHIVVPTAFDQAQDVGDKFKASQPVIMNLQAAEKGVSRRLIDFASGLCYGLGGQLERVANSVYLLTPSNVEVSAEERRRLQERGYDA